MTRNTNKETALGMTTDMIAYVASVIADLNNTLDGASLTRGVNDKMYATLGASGATLLHYVEGLGLTDKVPALAIDDEVLNKIALKIAGELLSIEEALEECAEGDYADEGYLVN